MSEHKTENTLGFFHPVIKNWFENSFDEPTPPQQMGWPIIQNEKNVLILAPTGSGKTLTAFLVCINKLLEKLLDAEEDLTGVFILYISPLKALNYDIERNLTIPLTGIRQEAEKSGIKIPEIRQAVRTGDTPQNERQQMIRKPPHILITTPESLHLLLTSKRARHMLASVRFVIVDEIHALSTDKRGTFLALLLERLQNLVQNDFVRIGLSATQKPLELVANFLGGYQKSGDDFQPRPVEIVDAGMRKNLDLQVISPVEDMTELPDASIWPSIYETLLKLIQNQKTTLIFSNNRAVVEKITTNLNEMVGEDLLRAHHGSVSKEVRKKIERQLKAGELTALVATATLELGIDIGSIDLVCQVESPHSVATGLQRVGRAGHLYKATSKGRLIPKMRSDLFETAAITRAMRRGEVAPITIPRNCLDVLAQQIVAMVALDSWPLKKLYELICQAMPFQKLPWSHFLNVVEMLSGRYPAKTFRQLKPRISWDRVNNILYPLPGSQRLVILNGGTIPETGQYPVYLREGMLRLGELEEEFVYEVRVGENFRLGTNTWKIIDIQPNRVLVSPAGGESARIPFWKGDISGIEPALGSQIGEFARELKKRLDSPDCLAWLQDECAMDYNAARNLQAYFKAQRKKVNAIPDDQTIVIESFRDELGDPRVAVLTPFGRCIHYALRLVILAQIQNNLNLEIESIDGDAGIIFRSTGEHLHVVGEAIKSITSENLESLLMDKILDSPLFGARFRQNAGRAMLLPRRMPGKRTPLWLLRMRSRDLLEIVRQYESFPIVVETYREILQDFFALDDLKTILDKIHSGEIQLLFRKSDSPSPFCSQLLFDFTAGYMYDYDLPKKTAQQATSGFNFDFLNELLESKNMSALLAPEAISDLEKQFQGINPVTQARDEIELWELLHRLGDLTTSELEERYQDDLGPALSKLTREGRYCQIYIANVEQPWRWITTENFPVYRAAFAIPNSNDKFEQFIQINIIKNDESSPVAAQTFLSHEIFDKKIERAAALDLLIETYLDFHPLVTLSDLQKRYPLPDEIVSDIIRNFQEKGILVQITDSDESKETQWAEKNTLEQLRRITLKKQRQQINPCNITRFVRFLFGWQHLTDESALDGEDGILITLEQLQGKELPAVVWENNILAGRIPGYRSHSLDRLISEGEITWYGSNSGNSETNGLCFSLIENLEFNRQIYNSEKKIELSPDSQKIVEYLNENGASFTTDIALTTGLRPDQCATELWELIWCGLVSNDSLSTIRQGKPHDPIAEISNSARQIPVASWQRNLRMRQRPQRRRTAGGRWRTFPPLPEINQQQLYELYVRQLFLRYGLICREIFEHDCAGNKNLNWRLTYETLVRMEWQGEIRRGYFVQGLSGIQFAIPGVVTELLSKESEQRNENSNELLLLNTCDPANLYGAGSPLPLKHPIRSEWTLRRHPNNFLIFYRGEPILAIEANGTRLTLLKDVDREQLVAALKLLVNLLEDPSGQGKLRRLKIESWNEIPVRKSPVFQILKEIGFRDEFKMMVLEKNY